MRLFFLFPALLVAIQTQAQIGDSLVYARDYLPYLKVELRYHGSNNFVGQPIDGYQNHKLILTPQSAQALKAVQDELETLGYCLLVYDGYRPQRAVNHFMRWASDLRDTINKQIFYPNVLKKNLFKEEYIASRSGHSRGSTVDLTIMDSSTGQIVDMGSPYDFFGHESWVEYDGISEQQKANRQLLQEVMLKHGFRNYPKEWWHFTLNNEPYPDTYFDVVIK